MITQRLSIAEAVVMALQLLSCGILFGQYLKRRDRFLFRCALGIGLYLILTWAMPGLPQPWDILVQPLVVYLLFLLLIWLLFDTEGKMLFFFFLTTVATQHMAVTMTDTLRALLRVFDRTLTWDLLCWLSFVCVLALCHLLFGKQMKHIAQIKTRSGRLIVISCIVFAVVYLLRVFSVVQLWELENGNPLLITVNLYGVIGSLASLFVLFMGNHEDTLAEEKQMIEQLLHEREAQERFTGETIDLVNMKYHDMKHLLSALRAERGQNVERILDEIEQGLPRYERVLHTGNADLDTILMTKMVYCEGKQIQLKCMIDGERLNFLSSADLYALFGNLLDNAIEAVREETPQRRTISLRVFPRRGYLCVHIENDCSHPPALENGMPKTRKQDNRYHGFGMKSIRCIAEKYGGNLTITIRDCLFCVDILFPAS